MLLDIAIDIVASTLNPCYTMFHSLNKPVKQNTPRSKLARGPLVDTFQNDPYNYFMDDNFLYNTVLS